MRIPGTLLLLTLALLAFSPLVTASSDWEDEIQLRPAPIIRGTGLLKFLNEALEGFKASSLKKLRAAKVLKFKAARSFTTRNRGFSFKKKDLLSLRMTKSGSFIISHKNKKTKGIILHRGSTKMGIVIIERKSGFKQFGRAFIAENDRIVVAPKMKKGSFKLNRGALRGKKLRPR